SSPSRRPAAEGPGEGARLRLATAHDTTPRRSAIRTRGRRARPSGRPRATLRPAGEQGRTTPDAWRATPPSVHHARHVGTRPRRALSTPATLRPLRGGAVAPRHSQPGAPRGGRGAGV